MKNPAQGAFKCLVRSPEQGSLHPECPLKCLKRHVQRGNPIQKPLGVGLLIYRIAPPGCPFTCPNTPILRTRSIPMSSILRSNDVPIYRDGPSFPGCPFKTLNRQSEEAPHVGYHFKCLISHTRRTPPRCPFKCLTCGYTEKDPTQGAPFRARPIELSPRTPPMVPIKPDRGPTE